MFPVASVLGGTVLALWVFLSVCAFIQSLGRAGESSGLRILREDRRVEPFTVRVF